MSIRMEAESPPPWPVVALFLGSGCAALVYEVVWLQLLQLTLGSTAVSLAALLAAFMGGLCLGSLALPRCVSPRRHPLRVYAVLELGVAALGLALFFGLPVLDQWYSRGTTPGLAGNLLRGLVAGLCLVPPAVLMGATLPAVARSVAADARGLSWLGWCYAANIVGGVGGCLVAGYYLLRVTDMQTTACVAAALNVTLAGVAWALAVTWPHVPLAERAAAESTAGPPRAWGVYLAIALSGGAALGGEVVWTRLLSLLLGGTVYTFSLILAVFLAGLGLGSSLGSLVAAQTRSPRRMLGLCQGLAVGAVAWAAYWLAEAYPHWPIFPPLAPGPWFTFQLDLVRCLWALLPATCLWGASFPLALAAAGGRDPARVVGEITAANTLGAIAGALSFSLVLIPTLGTAGCQRLMIGLAAAAAVAALAGHRSDAASGARSRLLGAALPLAALVCAAGWLAWRLEPLPWRVVAYGRLAAGIDALTPQTVANNTWDAAQRNTETRCLYLGEGRNVSVAVSQSRQGQRSFHGAGKVQASNLALDMRLQRMLGHLPALAHPRPKSVLVVACGAGVTAGSFLLHPDVERIVVCDIEPLVPTRVAPYFSAENYQLADGADRENPRRVHGKQVEFVYDDGRHYLRTTSEKFDVITSDPIDPWVKGCAALNTTEYYQACQARLNPGGLISLWCPLYESDEATARSFIGTFFGVFTNGLVFSNDRVGRGGYDAVLFGSAAASTTIDLDLIHRRLEQPEFQAVRESLRQVEWGLHRDPGVDLLSAYAGRAPDLADWLRDAELNTDRNLRLQYLAGMSLNRGLSDRILAEILARYRFPEGTFVGTPVRLRSLEQALFAAGRRER